MGLIPNYIILANNDIVTVSSCGYIAESTYVKRPLQNISIKDLDLINVVDTPKQAVVIINNFYKKYTLKPNF